MTRDEVMQALKAAGTEQARKTYARHGIKGPMFGASWAEYGKLAKKIKRDHGLALALWQTGNFDARVVATMVADPRQLDAKTLDAWAAAVDSYPLADAVAKLVAQSSAAQETARRWMACDQEFIAQTGWSVLGQRILQAPTADGPSADGPSADESSALELLDEIERTIHAAPNRVRYAMNGVLISIGARGGRLAEAALAAAGRIGKVEVDHGDTDCKTPDARQYIQKILDRNASKSKSVRDAKQTKAKPAKAKPASGRKTKVK